MKPNQSNPFMHKLSKSVPLSSLVWAALVTAIVLAVSSSANAQTDGETTNQRPTPSQIQKVEMRQNATEKREAAVERVAEKKDQMEAKREEMVSKREEMIEEAKSKRAEWQEKLSERRTSLEEKRAALASSTLERRAALKEAAQKRLINHSKVLANALKNAIGRLNGMVDKMEERANSLADRGVDVTETKEILAEADRVLTLAQQTADGMDDNATYAATSDTPKEDWSEAREQFMEVKELIHEARALLREALASLKEAVRQAQNMRGVSEAVRNDESNTSEEDN